MLSVVIMNPLTNGVSFVFFCSKEDNSNGLKVETFTYNPLQVIVYVENM